MPGQGPSGGQLPSAGRCRNAAYSPRPAGRRPRPRGGIRVILVVMVVPRVPRMWALELHKVYTHFWHNQAHELDPKPVAAAVVISPAARAIQHRPLHSGGPAETTALSRRPLLCNYQGWRARPARATPITTAPSPAEDPLRLAAALCTHPSLLPRGRAPGPQAPIATQAPRPRRLAMKHGRAAIAATTPSPSGTGRGTTATANRRIGSGVASVI